MRLRSTRLTAVAAAVQQLISAFSPTELFTQGEQGVWYDPSDFTRYMQTGEELVSNGTFDNGIDGWTERRSAVLTYSSSRLRVANGGATVSSGADAPITCQIGKRYRVTMTIAATSAGRVAFVRVADKTMNLATINDFRVSTQANPVGTYSAVFVATQTTHYVFAQIDGGVLGDWVEFDNISVRELTAIDTCTLFQDSAGTTPVTAVEQPVGLMLDKRLGLVQGPELYAGGNISGVPMGGSTFNNYTLGITAEVGKTYRFSINVTDYAGSGTYSVGGIFGTDWVANTPAKAGNGLWTFTIIALRTTPITLFTRDTNTANFSNISIRELPGNHAFQPTTTNRPILGVHPNTGVRNILHGSASTASNIYWLTNQIQNGITSTKVNHGIDVDGLPFCDYRFTGTATNNFMDLIYSNALVRTSATPGQSFTLSAICKRVSGTEPTGSGLRVGVVEETTPGTYIGITTNAGTISSTQEALYTATRTISTGNQARVAFVVSLITGETIDVTYRIKAAQFEAGTSRSKFQFNYSPLNIVEPGVSGNYYLRCDGIDDFMVTNNIDFTSTDKVTVFAGVRKLSDALRGVVFELSQTLASNPGTFLFTAPEVNAAANTGLFTRGSVFTGVPAYGIIASPASFVMSGKLDISSDENILRINSVLAGSVSADQGTGNYGNYPLYLFRRGGTTLPFNGNFYGLIIRGALSSTNEIINTEAYMATRTGFTAPVIEQLPLLEVLP